MSPPSQVFTEPYLHPAEAGFFFVTLARGPSAPTLDLAKFRRVSRFVLIRPGDLRRHALPLLRQLQQNFSLPRGWRAGSHAAALQCVGFAKFGADGFSQGCVAVG